MVSFRLLLSVILFLQLLTGDGFAEILSIENATVVSLEGKVRKEPTKNSPVIAVLKKGEKLQVEKLQEGLASNY